MRKWNQLLLAVSLVGLCACGGGGGGSAQEALPPGAAAVRTTSQDMGFELAEITVRIGDLVPLFLDSSSPEAVAAGVQVTLDQSPGALPNTYDFSAPLDWDGDGVNDSTGTGKVVLSVQLGTNVGPGVQATVDVQIDVQNGEGEVSGSFELLRGLIGSQASCDLTFTRAASNTEVRLVVPDTAPLALRNPRPDDAANLCRISVEGSMEVTTTASEGLFEAVWRFLHGSPTVQVQTPRFTPPGGATETIPESSFTVGPCSGSIDDWVGTFLLDWECDGVETGQSRLVITRTNPTTLRIESTEVPPSGLPLIYQATVDPANPLVARGRFTDTDGGGTYDEDFVWTLDAAGDVFTQRTIYRYRVGGAAGTCVGTATRE